MAIINGSSYSRIELIGGAGETTLDLPKTNQEGLVETLITVQLEHNLLNYTDEIKIQGCKIKFTFNYGKWVLGETLMKFQQIWRHVKSGGSLQLTPRVDLPTRFFIVNYTGEPIDTGIKGAGLYKARYNRLPVISFMTKLLEADPKWQLTAPEIAAPGGGSGIPFEGGM